MYALRIQNTNESSDPLSYEATKGYFIYILFYA